jgi:predicted HicB family RNase H-like nuclease
MPSYSISLNQTLNTKVVAKAEASNKSVEEWIRELVEKEVTKRG